MGFGTLFIGYFLLLNIVYYSITDVICASVMLLGLYSLYKINRFFKLSAYLCAGFCAFSIVELYFGLKDMFFGVSTSATLISVFSAIRFLLVGTLTVAILLAIREVSIEVELEEMPLKCMSRVILSSVIFGFGLLLETPLLHFLGVRTLYVLSALTVLAELFIVAMNLTVIYGAYMRICMPKDNLPRGNGEVKKSRFGFINQYRERKAEKEREEAEYRLGKLEQLAKRNKERKKKK